MLMRKNRQSTTAAIALLGIIAISASGFIMPEVASAKKTQITTTKQIQFPSRDRDLFIATVPEGTLIPIEYEEAEKIIVTPDETADFTLTVATDIIGDDNRVAIPAGSLIKGEMRPNRGGTQFVAEELVFVDINLDEEESFPIEATSRIITETTFVNRRSNPDIFRGAAIGAAAGALLGEILGDDIDWFEVLAGVGAGILTELLITEEEEVEVIIIEPERDLDLRLESDLLFDFSS